MLRIISQNHCEEFPYNLIKLSIDDAKGGSTLIAEYRSKEHTIEVMERLKTKYIHFNLWKSDNSYRCSTRLDDSDFYFQFPED